MNPVVLGKVYSVNSLGTLSLRSDTRTKGDVSVATGCDRLDAVQRGYGSERIIDVDLVGKCVY